MVKFTTRIKKSLRRSFAAESSAGGSTASEASSESNATPVELSMNSAIEKLRIECSQRGPPSSGTDRLDAPSVFLAPTEVYEAASGVPGSSVSNDMRTSSTLNDVNRYLEREHSMISTAAGYPAGLPAWGPKEAFVVAKTIGLVFQRFWSESRKPEYRDFPDFLSEPKTSKEKRLVTITKSWLREMTIGGSEGEMEWIPTGRPLPVSPSAIAADEWIQGLFHYRRLDLKELEGGNMWVMNRDEPLEGPWVELVEMTRDTGGLYVDIDFILCSGPEQAMEARRRAGFALRSDT